MRDPTPVYPHSLIWRRDNPHPALATLRRYLAAGRPGRPAERPDLDPDAETWAPPSLGAGLSPARPRHRTAASRAR